MDAARISHFANDSSRTLSTHRNQTCRCASTVGPLQTADGALQVVRPPTGSGIYRVNEVTPSRERFHPQLLFYLAAYPRQPNIKSLQHCLGLSKQQQTSELPQNATFDSARCRLSQFAAGIGNCIDDRIGLWLALPFGLLFFLLPFFLTLYPPHVSGFTLPGLTPAAD